MTTMATDSETLRDASARFAQVSDARLLARYARRGDPLAFGVLSERYHPMVLATCERALGNRADAEDVAQETFLKLAQHAGRVKSNVAAWLHRCAMRACVDLIRKRGSARRAEARAQERDPAGDPAERTWRELEPMLDDALAKLSEKERNWIVARFLTGSTNAEVASAEGVNPGTMSRRVEKALKKLRAHLVAGGLVLAGGVSLGAVLGHAAPAAAGSSLPLTKLALAGTATTARLGVLSAGAIALTAGAVIGVGALGGGAYVAFAPTSPARVTQEGEPVARAKKRSKEFPLTNSTSDNAYYETMLWRGDTLTFFLSEDKRGERRQRVVFRVTEEKGSDTKGEMRLYVARSTADEDSLFTKLVGQTIDATYRVDKVGRLWLSSEVETPNGPAGQNWIGARPIKPTGEPIAGPVDDNPLSGEWVEVSDWYLRLDKDNVWVGNEYFTLYRFRILGWEEADGRTNIRAIVADSVIPGYVGDRVGLILRKDEHGYLLAHHEPDSKNADRFPKSFDPKPGANLRVLRFSEDSP